MTKLYNEAIKEKFLSQYDNEATQRTIRNVFLNTFLIEDTLEKDLYDMSLEQLGKSLSNTNPHTKNVSRSNGRFISQYISWAIENGYRKSNINLLKGIDFDFFDNLVDRNRKIHYSFDEFIELMEDKNMMNGQDQAYLFLIFEGILGEKFSELRELKFSDINWDKKAVYVKERNKHINVTDECIKYLQKAFNENTYYQYNSESGQFSEKELLESQYIFKNIRSPRGTENTPVKLNVFYNRLHTMKELFNLEYLTPNAIKQSGMLYYAIKEYEKDGVLGYEQLAAVGERYNYSMINNNGYEYYNTYLMREFINEQNIKDLYDLDIEVKLR